MAFFGTYNVMLDTSIATIEVYNVANEVSGVMADNSIIAIEVPAKESDGCAK